MSNDERPQNKSNPQTPSARGQKQTTGGQKSQHPTIKNVLGKDVTLDPALRLSKDPNLPKLVFFKYYDPNLVQNPQVIAGLKKDIAGLNKTIKTLEGRIAVQSAGGRKTPSGFQSRLGELKQELSATKQSLTKEKGKSMPGLLLGIDSGMHLKKPEDKFDSDPAIDPERVKVVTHIRQAFEGTRYNIHTPVYIDAKQGWFLTKEQTGGDLKQYMSRQNATPFTPHEAAEHMLGLLDTVTHMHKRGIIHRDIKPANVFVDLGRKHNKPKLSLADFETAMYEGRASPNKMFKKRQRRKAISTYNLATDVHQTPVYGSFHPLETGKKISFKQAMEIGKASDLDALIQTFAWLDEPLRKDPQLQAEYKEILMTINPSLDPDLMDKAENLEKQLQQARATISRIVEPIDKNRRDRGKTRMALRNQITTLKREIRIQSEQNKSQPNTAATTTPKPKIEELELNLQQLESKHDEEFNAEEKTLSENKEYKSAKSSESNALKGQKNEPRDSKRRITKHDEKQEIYDDKNKFTGKKILSKLTAGLDKMKVFLQGIAKEKSRPQSVGGKKTTAAGGEKTTAFVVQQGPPSPESAAALQKKTPTSKAKPASVGSTLQTRYGDPARTKLAASKKQQNQTPETPSR